MKNFLVIGVGPHARRNHLPALMAGQASHLVGMVVGVDVTESAEAIAQFNAGLGGQRIPVTYVDSFEPATRFLPTSVRESLDSLVTRYAIDAVVVSTEPSVHMVYTRWALERGLSVLLDKPLSVRENCSVDPGQASAILTDFDELLEAYGNARSWKPETLVSVQCQRRYHPAFLRMRSLVAEVAAQTNCPVTSIQSFHSDGQWRMPNELIDISYHSFDKGYGKGAHSGYHFFDIVPWLLQAGETAEKEIDSVDIHANVVRPGDLLSQLTIRDYERLFPGFAANNPYSEEELFARTKEFGEVDAFFSMAFKSSGRTMTLGSINLAHNGFSQRGNMTPNHADLYKGNGRVRHESHIIEQGPFQAIHFHSLQSLGGGRDCSEAVGGEEHVEVHVFRNSSFNESWKTHESYDFYALATATASELEVPTQSASRGRAMKEFLEYINGKLSREQMASELTTHRRSSTLMAGAYLSTAQQWTHAAPVVTLGFRANAAGTGPPAHGSEAEHDLLDSAI